MEKLSNTLLGVGSVSLIETIPALPQQVGLDIPTVIQTIIQLIVGVGTLLAMFKKKQNVTS